MSSTVKRIRFVALGLGALLCAGAVFGWVQINPRDMTGDDVGLHLTGGSITFRIEQDGSFDINDSSDVTAIRNSFANIDTIPTSDATVVEGAPFNLDSPVDVFDGISGSDGVNRLFFFETDVDGEFGADALAGAFIFFNAATGQITDCDIAFNDAGVEWSTFTPDDPAEILPAEEFDIESAANQEIMHCFGIDHSPIAGRFDPATGLQVDGDLSGDYSLQSSVFPLIPLTIEGRSFEEDDIAAFSSLYPNLAADDAFGNISGTILRSDGREIKGAHVVAVPTDDETLPTVGALSGIDFSLPAGGYVISGLLPGNYLVRIEPLLGTTNPFTDEDSSFIGFDTSFAPEFFSGVAESDTDVEIAADDAQPVTVAAGFQRLNIDITVNTTPPPNDDFDAAILITSTPFADTQETLEATTEAADPVPCGNPSPAKSVWYRFTASSGGTLTADTFGSGYDTVLSAWSGTVGNLNLVDCNDQADGGNQSEITFTATPGTTYFFMVTAFLSDGGALVFNLDLETPALTLSSDALVFAARAIGTTSTAQTVTLSNPGAAALNISAVSDTGDFDANHTCGSSLGVGANCTVSVTFTPTAEGTRNGSVIIDDDASGSPHTISLSGSGPDFSLTSSTNSATVAPGGTATYTLTFSSTIGFTGTVGLTCSGAPQAATCSISPTSVVLDGTNDATATVSVTTTAPASVPSLLGPFSGKPWLPWFLALAALLSLLSSLRARRVGPVLATALLFAAFGPSCGSTPPGGGSLSTPVGTSTLTVTATSGGVVHTVDLTLNVN